MVDASLSSSAVSLYFYPMHGSLTRLREIVGSLQAQPCIGAAAERKVKTDRHFGRDTASRVNQIIKRLTRNAQNTGSFRYGQP